MDGHLKRSVPTCPDEGVSEPLGTVRTVITQHPKGERADSLSKCQAVATKLETNLEFTVFTSYHLLLPAQSFRALFTIIHFSSGQRSVLILDIPSSIDPSLQPEEAPPTHTDSISLQARPHVPLLPWQWLPIRNQFHLVWELLKSQASSTALLSSECKRCAPTLRRLKSGYIYSFS